jgi:hypothetical protein
MNGVWMYGAAYCWRKHRHVSEGFAARQSAFTPPDAVAFQTGSAAMKQSRYHVELLETCIGQG